MSIQLAIANKLQSVLLPMTNAKLTKISLTKGNEMLRAGGGFNEHRGFVRIDLWRKAFRLTQR